MNPAHDIICSLVEVPFARRSEEERRDVLNEGRPMFPLTLLKKKREKVYNADFKVSWFTSYDWLCSSPTLQRLFCWPCLLTCTKQHVWNKEGFSDVTNITRGLQKHSDSREHLRCVLALKNYEKAQNATTAALEENDKLFKVHYNENVRLNRLFLQIVIDAILYLSRQELPFQSHDESNDSTNGGNFKELLALLISGSSPEIKNQYERIKSVFACDSKSIQVELIHCISDYIDDYVKSEIKEADFFSIQVDDTTELTQISECSVIVRFVDSEGRVVERFLGFHDVSADRTSVALHDMLEIILKQIDYERKLIAQSYDGASVMPQPLNELQQKIKERAPQAAFVHSLAHPLNFVLQESFKKISPCRIFFASFSGIASFFRQSANRLYTREPTIEEVRWSSSSNLIRVIVEDWNKLKEVFEFVTTCEESSPESLRLASGFLRDFNNFEFTFLAVVFNDLFSSTDILFDVLQEKSLDMAFCISEIKRTRELLNNKRNDEFFKSLFQTATSMTQIDNIKREYDVFTEDAISEKFEVLFYEILDHIIMEMDLRFQDLNMLQFVPLIDTTKFEQYNSCFPSDILERLDHFYEKSFTKILRLKNELSLLYADESYRNMSPQQLLQNLNEHKEIFVESYKLFCLILTLPSTNASVESFSCVKRIETYLKNMVSQKRLSSLANISIQKELLQQLIKKKPFYEDIIDKFASMQNRLIDFLYKK